MGMTLGEDSFLCFTFLLICPWEKHRLLPLEIISSKEKHPRKGISPFYISHKGLFRDISILTSVYRSHPGCRHWGVLGGLWQGELGRQLLKSNLQWDFCSLPAPSCRLSTLSNLALDFWNFSTLVKNFSYETWNGKRTLEGREAT